MESQSGPQMQALVTVLTLKSSQLRENQIIAVLKQ
jgi:hypothetical protein